jgi:integrase
LQAERRKLPNVDNLLLTINGQPIDKLKFEYDFRKARKAAEIKNFNFHDLRHCAITRWAAAGVPTAAAMLAAGHSSVGEPQTLPEPFKVRPENRFRSVHGAFTGKNRAERISGK